MSAAFKKKLIPGNFLGSQQKKKNRFSLKIATIAKQPRGRRQAWGRGQCQVPAPEEWGLCPPSNRGLPPRRRRKFRPQIPGPTFLPLRQLDGRVRHEVEAVGVRGGVLRSVGGVTARQDSMDGSSHPPAVQGPVASLVQQGVPIREPGGPERPARAGCRVR
ncbi:uncharacterized protein STAUR_6981 [Stigmatella aurantiaca DW4/3-1]|uniref:Uncharacterized protein n=1 Tax=Stigmatella aurantiaca (strain DW4/3-1) TaxID=378806 RepID=E3FW16_STIAD|nr:uncharacterized protein STAUR_6981 [Stigmatella aurantiaca DW4/3-1]